MVYADVYSFPNPNVWINYRLNDQEIRSIKEASGGDHDFEIQLSVDGYLHIYQMTFKKE